MKEIMGRKREREELQFKKELNKPRDDDLTSGLFFKEEEDQMEELPWTLEEISEIFEKEKDQMRAFSTVREAAGFAKWGESGSTR
jgi:hypothetical protein